MEYWNIIYFPIHLPKCVINMLLVSVCSYEDVYEVISMFHNTKSYFDLKPHKHFPDMLIYGTQFKY